MFKRGARMLLLPSACQHTRCARCGQHKAQLYCGLPSTSSELFTRHSATSSKHILRPSTAASPKRQRAQTSPLPLPLPPLPGPLPCRPESADAAACASVLLPLLPPLHRHLTDRQAPPSQPLLPCGLLALPAGAGCGPAAAGLAGQRAQHRPSAARVQRLLGAGWAALQLEQLECRCECPRASLQVLSVQGPNSCLSADACLLDLNIHTLQGASRTCKPGCHVTTCMHMHMPLTQGRRWRRQLKQQAAAKGVVEGPLGAAGLVQGQARVGGQGRRGGRALGGLLLRL